ncbi:MAG: C40 family peptidase [Limnochordales bacterium]|nr:C40 family peptidase [Limnochordales bacterium]
MQKAGRVSEQMSQPEVDGATEEWTVSQDQAGKQGYIIANIVSLHAEPSEDSEVVTQARMGETFRLVSEAAGWWRITLDYDGYPGYIPAGAGRLVEPASDEGDGQGGAGLPDNQTPYAVVSNLFGNVYAAPTIKSRLLVTLPIGVKVYLHSEPAGQVGEWWAVTLPDGRQGFMHMGDLSENGREWAWSTVAELRASLVRTARRFVGIPYRWGGTSPFGIDCSGLVQLLYRLHGLFLPRDARDQGRYEKTRPVTRADLVPGDLIFFSDYGHVGMAISHFEFIHATARGSPVVQISRIDDPYYSGECCDIRRYLL